MHLAKYSYQYDANGNRTVETLLSGKHNEYAYDALNRLVVEKEDLNSSGSPTASTLEQVYGYDGAGNRTSLVLTWYQETGGLLNKSLTGTTDNFSFQYNAADQLMYYTFNGDPTNYTYNGLGQRTAQSASNGTTSFSYNGAGDLTGISGPNGQETFTYNGLSQRVGGTTPSGTVKYLWSGDVMINATKTGSGGFDYLYTYGPGGLISRNNNGTGTFYGVDGKGNVTVTENGSGSQQNTYSYTAFGWIKNQSGSSPETQTFVGAQGVQLDSTSGLYYMYHRWYDPFGRFISEDPFPPDLTDPQSLNRYVYVKNNPLIYTDPAGLFRVSQGPFDMYFFENGSFWVDKHFVYEEGQGWFPEDPKWHKHPLWSLMLGPGALYYWSTTPGYDTWEDACQY